MDFFQKNKLYLKQNLIEIISPKKWSGEWTYLRMQGRVKYRYRGTIDETFYVICSGKSTNACNMNKSLKNLTTYFWWSNKRIYITEYINSCFFCQIMRNGKFLFARNGNLSGRFCLYRIIGPEK